MKNVWGVPAYLPYIQPDLTPQMISQAEARIGHQLPEAYLDLLRVQNGGYIRYGLPDSVHDVIAGIGPYFPSITDVRWEEVRDWVSFELNGLVPFDGDGHWNLCLDYRVGNEPCVTLADIECDHESKIADSFADYLDLLQLDVGDDDLALVDVTDLEGLKRHLALELPIAFDEPDSWAHGYPSHRARSKEFANVCWLWISPNLVPRGFVRPDDERYIELKDKMPGMARRYNELTDKSYILNIVDTVREPVLEALHKASIVFKPLADIAD